MRAACRRRSEASDQGSIAIEFSFLALVVFALLGLIVAYGRVAEVNGTLDSGTRDAARAATVARSYDQAVSDARRTVREAVPVEACRNSLDITVSHPFTPGAEVTVTATCHYSLADAGMFFAHVTMHPTSRFTSPLDPNRGIDG